MLEQGDELTSRDDVIAAAKAALARPPISN